MSESMLLSGTGGVLGLERRAGSRIDGGGAGRAEALVRIELDRPVQRQLPGAPRGGGAIR